MSRLEGVEPPSEDGVRRTRRRPGPTPVEVVGGIVMDVAPHPVASAATTTTGTTCSFMDVIVKLATAAPQRNLDRAAGANLPELPTADCLSPLLPSPQALAPT